MAIIVQKYGGSSVGTPDKLKRVADLVTARRRQGVSLVVVVSAMGDTTDELLALAGAVSSKPPRRELDMLASCGERISMALLCMALAERGEAAVSFTGSQSGIITDDNHFAARIVEVRPQRITDALAAGKIVVVAGYQGMSRGREITTLGRGGSDTTAVALAAALQAEACEIYSDVDGVFSADPRVVPDARRIPSLSYREMETFAGAGAKVLNAEAVAFAREAGITIAAKKTGLDSPGTVVAASADAVPTKRTAAGVAIKAGALFVAWPETTLQRVAELLDRYRARPEALSFSAARAAFVLDLENVPEAPALQDELRAAGATLHGRDVVSLVGEAIGLNTDAVSRALALAGGASHAHVETHRVVVCVDQGHGAATAKEWHREIASLP